jgi:hypothetical protein
VPPGPRRVAILGLLAILGLAPVARGSEDISPTSAATVNAIVTDKGVTLSRSSLPVGTVTFRVTNRGLHRHAFRIAAEATPALAPGRSALLRIAFGQPGRVRYLVPGLPSGWLRLIAAAPSSPGVITPIQTATAQPTSAQPLCASPVTSTVAVTMTDTTGPSGYTFSPATLRCGSATFVLTNTGKSGHGLDLEDPLGQILAPSPKVPPGQTLSVTIDLAYVGTYAWADISAGFDAEFAETSNGHVVVE